MPVLTFAEHYDWTGKKIIPFVTSGGSGFGKSLRDLAKSAKGAEIDKDGLAVLGTQVENSKDKIQTWAKSRVNAAVFGGGKHTWPLALQFVIGFRGEFLFAGSLQEARVMVVANRGVMPTEGSDHDTWFGASMKRIPLIRGGEPVARTYCAFWRKDNSGYYVEEFADILKKVRVADYKKQTELAASTDIIE